LKQFSLIIDENWQAYEALGMFRSMKRSTLKKILVLANVFGAIIIMIVVLV